MDLVKFVYVYRADSGQDGFGSAPFSSLDGEWDHTNGSSRWDSSGPGGGGCPGGAAIFDEAGISFLRIQDTGDPRGAPNPCGESSNRKIYFGRNLDELQIAPNWLDSGPRWSSARGYPRWPIARRPLTLGKTESFRMSVTTILTVLAPAATSGFSILKRGTGGGLNSARSAGRRCREPDASIAMLGDCEASRAKPPLTSGLAISARGEFLTAAREVVILLGLGFPSDVECGSRVRDH